MRVLSLHPATTELMFAIGAGDLLVGRTDSCDYPQAALKVPSIGPIDEVSEVIVEVFEPSLVLLGGGQEALDEELAKKYRVVSFDPNSLDTVFMSIANVAELLGKQVEADVVVHDLRILLERLAEKIAKFHSVKVYCEVEHTPPAAVSGYVNELIAAAGGIALQGEVTPERLQEFDPQVIISSVPGEDEFNFELLTARDGWSDLTAVQHERLFNISDEFLHRPGPRLQKGIKLLAKLLHGVELNGE